MFEALAYFETVINEKRCAPWRPYAVGVMRVNPEQGLPRRKVGSVKTKPSMEERSSEMVSQFLSYLSKEV